MVRTVPTLLAMVLIIVALTAAVVYCDELSDALKILKEAYNETVAELKLVDVLRAVTKLMYASLHSNDTRICQAMDLALRAAKLLNKYCDTDDFRYYVEANSYIAETIVLLEQLTRQKRGSSPSTVDQTLSTKYNVSTLGQRSKESPMMNLLKNTWLYVLVALAIAITVVSARYVPRFKRSVKSERAEAKEEVTKLP